MREDIFNRWAALPEWEQQARRFYPFAQEYEFQMLRIAARFAKSLGILLHFLELDSVTLAKYR